MSLESHSDIFNHSVNFNFSRTDFGEFRKDYLFFPLRCLIVKIRCLNDNGIVYNANVLIAANKYSCIKK